MIVYTEFALVVEKYSHAPRIWSKGTKIDFFSGGIYALNEWGYKTGLPPVMGVIVCLR